MDAGTLVNRGVLTELRLKGPLGALLSATFVPGVRLVRTVYDVPGLSWIAGSARSLLGMFPGPAHGRGAPAVIGARFHAGPPTAPSPSRDAATPESGDAVRAESAPSAAARNGSPDKAAVAHAQSPDDRALHCVNCGECNTVCPIFQESKIRLPQMLTHLGESMRGGTPPPVSGSVLLDLCMRCGNCEEVCQAGIPHLPLYESMQRDADRTRPRDVERHTAIVAAVRGSSRYTRDFLKVRPGGYLKRSPASLPGMARFIVLRAENDAGPSASCIHCGACVSVCPTHANREFEGADPRWITTAQERCIGCGTCVEVCPANLANGGQTLRVFEAPTRDWFVAIDELERGGAS
jgi:ferredoxin